MASLKEHQEVLLELLTEFDRVCKKHHIHYILFAGSALGAVRHQGFIPWDDDLDVAVLRADYDRLMKLPSSEWDTAYYLQGEYSPHWPMHFSKLRKNNTTCLEKYHPKDNQIHQGIYIDVFPIDNASDNAFVRKLQFYASKLVMAKAFSKRGYETSSMLKKAVMLSARWMPTKLFHQFTVMKAKNNTKLVHSFFGGSIRFEKGLYDRKWFTERAEVPFENICVPISLHYDAMLTTMYGDYMIPPPEEDRKCKEHALLVDTQKNYTEYEHFRDGMDFEVLTRSIR